MRYLGRRVWLEGPVPQNFTAEVVTDRKRREEGVRIKHRINDNSLKAYDKPFTTFGNALRFEATTLKVSGLKAYRPKEGDVAADAAGNCRPAPAGGSLPTGHGTIHECAGAGG